jgi:hypothetical protein
MVGWPLFGNRAVVDWWGGQVFIWVFGVLFGILDKPAPTLVFFGSPPLLLFVFDYMGGTDPFAFVIVITQNSLPIGICH